ncbi:hypothetical protein P7K49_038671 [Saguinus oedipus]|uniref:Uncharacterized protein n=1 Tax=Saguinus oedipus TaxID=9490 RepID=A0ABQ9TFE3_SAGOE|nr:hypothetical protein P7K49_038671 [Saguinus oedipus]
METGRKRRLKGLEVAEDGGGGWLLPRREGFLEAEPALSLFILAGLESVSCRSFASSGLIPPLGRQGPGRSGENRGPLLVRGPRTGPARFTSRPPDRALGVGRRRRCGPWCRWREQGETGRGIEEELSSDKRQLLSVRPARRQFGRARD